MESPVPGGEPEGGMGVEAEGADEGAVEGKVEREGDGERAGEREKAA